MSVHQTSAANVYITGTLTLLYDCFSLAMSYLPVISLPSSKYLSSISDMLLCKTTVCCFLILLINITCPFIFIFYYRYICHIFSLSCLDIPLTLTVYLYNLYFLSLCLTLIYLYFQCLLLVR